MATDAEQACIELSRLLPDVVGVETTDGYKRWIVELATAVAETAKENGQRISPGEVAVIERVSKALGFDDSPR